MGGMKWGRTNIPPPDHRDDLRLLAPASHADRADRLDKFVSTKRIETFLVDDIEQLQRWSVRLLFTLWLANCYFAYKNRQTTDLAPDKSLPYPV